MLMACGRPQEGRDQSHVDACGQRRVKNLDFLVDVINE